MIFIANVLELNGGTTFLIRVCAALKAGGHPCAVVVLRRGGSAALAETLAQHATVFALEDFQVDRGRILRRHLGTFAPLDWSRLRRALAPFGSVLHAMGAFGLVFAARLARRDPAIRVTIGIYHQNEFIFRDRPVFSRRILKLFRAMPPENILFFNEVSRHHYSLFHGVDYDGRSSLTPIGITIPPRADEPGPRRLDHRIVSVGSLERFKIYNRHIIALLPQLAAAFPGISYDIHGNGECLGELQALADDLGVRARVTFHGALAYERFHEIVRAGDVFVGSGTALIEAAAAGRPALIGVESIEQPLTYGFLCDIEGLSYNEASAAQPMRTMLGCLRAVLSDPDEWKAVADACFLKAHDFSVERTAEAFRALAGSAAPLQSTVGAGETMRMLAELPLLALWDRMSPEFAFAQRRNQSFQG